MTRVKICGLTNAVDRDRAVTAGADALGFIVDVPVDTHRELDVDRARELIESTPPMVSTVVVTMDADPRTARDLVAATGCDSIQLHGGSSKTIEALVTDASASVIEAVDLAETATDAIDSPADAILLDATDDAGAGGTGRTIDWELAGTVAETTEQPTILAGGLTPANVDRAIRAVRPYAVDVSSGVERSDGTKAASAIERFIERSRAVEGVTA